MIAEKNRHTTRLPQPKSSSSSKQGLDYHRAVIIARDQKKELRREATNTPTKTKVQVLKSRL
jgi:hypothetical protein